MIILTAEQAQQIEESLESCFCYDQNDQRYLPSAAEEALATIRAARAQGQAEQEPLTDAPFSNCKYQFCDLPGQCIGEGKCHHPNKLTAAPVEPVKQEPVAWMCWIDSDEEMNPANAQLTSYEPKAYAKTRPLVFGDAAPVQQVDLTDAEIADIGTSCGTSMWSLMFARAIIAADREKNK